MQKPCVPVTVTLRVHRCVPNRTPRGWGRRTTFDIMMQEIYILMHENHRHNP